MKTVCVTGSLGLVGSAVCELFEQKGWKIVGIDNNNRSKFFGTDKKENQYTVTRDFRDMVAMEDLFQEVRFDAVIHAGGQPSHDYATDHVLEDFHVNATGTVNLLEALRQTNPEGTFVYISTDKVYGENMSRNNWIDAGIGTPESALQELPTRYHSSRPFNEKLGLDFAGDRSFFGCSKAAGDMYTQQYAARGMKVGIFRPGCITGKNHAGAEQHGFLAYLAKCIKDEKVYKIFGNGKNVRDQIHSTDLANAIWQFMEKPKVAGVYNIGGGPTRSVSVLEAGELLSKAIGKPFLHEFHEARKGDRLWDVHDISKFCKDYPEWDYQYSLDDIIADLV